MQMTPSKDSSKDNAIILGIVYILILRKQIQILIVFS